MRRNHLARQARRFASYGLISLSLAIPIAAQSPRMAGFEERRKLGIGQFLTTDVFEKDPDRPLSDILGRIPGVRFSYAAGQRVLTSTRNGGRACRLHIVVDGAPLEGVGNQTDFDINSISTREVAGVEYYTVSTTPAKFSPALFPGVESCGTIVIWTKL